MALRSVKRYWQELKQSDPHCPVGLGTLRAAVKSGVIPSFKVGRATVIEASTVMDYLFPAQAGKGEQAHQPGEVRRVDP